ncbi:RNA polymerase sigma factor [Steroidobacter sp.]|uniref:RNA polymerase sigma factor n=1 Tax=Steroidobacter sp. TaxID=1978227 RepID=UPI0025CFE5F5|nr:sigma-70 family RNA polymerase sigma factor [Steroidobacter sp.]
MTEPQSSEQQGVGGDARQQLVARLFQEHNDALLRFLALRLHSHQEAKEVAQEAYVKLLNLDQPEAISYQRAFLFKIAANLAIDRRRGGDRRERARETGLFTELNEVPTPEHEATVAQEVAHLEKLIAQLPAKCRQAFLLYKIQGLDFVEVAQRMNLSERMVRDYVTRALVYCRVGLDQEFPHG